MHINFLITEVIMDFGRERFLPCFHEDKYCKGFEAKKIFSDSELE